MDWSKFVKPNVAPPSAYYEGLQYRWRQLVFRPAEFKLEALILLGILSYFLLAQLGAYRNARKANAWLDAHRPLLEAQFSSPTSVSGSLIADGYSDFYNFSTGRRGIASLHTLFTFQPRHDIFQMLFNIAWSLGDLSYNPQDEIQLEFTLPANSTVPNFVWGVADKDYVMSLRKGRWDLAFTKTTDNPTLPPNLCTMTEFADVTDALLKPSPTLSLANLLKDRETARYFRSLVVSDQPMESPDRLVPLMEQTKRVVLSLRAPPPSKASETVPIVSIMFALIDYMSKSLALRPETKIKVKKTRMDMEEVLKKEDKKDDTADEKKRANKRKAEEERVARLSAAEQKKHEERERKRVMRKAQGKGGVSRKA